MRRISEEELKDIVEKHLHWLKKDCYGWEAMQADLSNTDLFGVNLAYANLASANLRGAKDRKSVV